MEMRYESALDKQIREAQERGDFDDLPGMGKPLPNRNELTDEDWWLKRFVEREGITGVLPTTLKLRKELDEIDETAARERTEAGVRRLVSDLNRRVVEALRGPMDGPKVSLRPLNADAVVTRWRQTTKN